MVKQGSTTFLATKVAKAGFVAFSDLQEIMDLEKEVSKLRHYVSLLSKRGIICCRRRRMRGQGWRR